MPLRGEVSGRLAPLIALAWACLAAAPVTAYEIRMSATTPTEVEVGETISVDVFLDTQGESRIGVIAFSVVFDDSRFVYRRDLSDAEDQILYSPFGGKGSNQPARWMEPLPDPPELWPPANPVRVTPGFITGLGYTFATATNVRMATLTFEAIAPGSSLFDVSLDYDSDGFGIEDPNDGTVLYITDQVSVLGDFVATVGGAEAVPGLAVGLGGLALGSMLLAIGARAIAGKPRD